MIRARSSVGTTRGSDPCHVPALFAVLAALLLASQAHAQTKPLVIQGNQELAFRSPGYAPDVLLVKFRDNVGPDERQAAVAAEGASLTRAITDDGLVKIRLRPGQSVMDGMDVWNRRIDVEYAAPNLYAQSFFTPNDTTIATFDLAWNLRAIHAYEAWDVVTGDPSIVLAIIDTGMAFEDRVIPGYERPFVKPGVAMYRRSPDLPGPFRAGWDFVHDDPDANDDNGHGTSVATIAAGAANNTAGSAGVAFGIALMPIKVVDYRNDSSMEWIVAGIRFAADHGADVANLSLGFPPVRLFRVLGYTEDFLAHMFKPLRDAVNYAQRKGTILVASSGNFGAPQVSLPAAYPGVIAVGATNVDDARASYSSFGSDLDLMAPGGDFTELNGDHVQDGVAALSIKPFRSEGSLANPDSFGVFVSFGTSNSAPHVSGAVALLLSLGLRGQGQIESVLRSTAVNRFQATNAFSTRYGYGLIQLDAAVRKAAGSGAAAAAALPGTLQARMESGNPSSGQARLSYRLTRSGPVRVRVYDARGSLVRSLDDRVAQAGSHMIAWDGRSASGSAAPSGVYWMRVDSPEGSAVRKVALLR